MTVEKSTKSRRVSISKRKLSNTAGAMQAAAVTTAIIGEQKALKGAEKLQQADDLGSVATIAIAKGASDLTRAEDVNLMSNRMAVLSDVVATAGVADVAQGAEMLAASEDVGVVSALIGMMSADDLEHGLELARLSGELHTVSEMVDGLKMPVLANFLSARAARLHEMSVEQIRLSISADGVSQVLAGAGQRITSLGENEVEEGLVRLATSEAVSAESAAMSKASQDLAVQGIEEMVIGGDVTQAAREKAAEGAAELSAGSATLGAALAMDDMASTLKEKASDSEP
jgi:hypothetical protein